MAAFAMHRKTTAAFVQFEPRVWPDQILNSTRSFGPRRTVSRCHRITGAEGTARPDLTFKTLSAIVASVCFFRAMRDVTNRRYLVISAENWRADPGTSTYQLLCTYSTNEKYTSAADAVTRFTSPPPGSDVSLLDLFHYSSSDSRSAPIYNNNENNG